MTTENPLSRLEQWLQKYSEDDSHLPVRTGNTLQAAGHLIMPERIREPEGRTLARRDFLKLSGLALGAGVLGAACRRIFSPAGGNQPESVVATLQTRTPTPTVAPTPTEAKKLDSFVSAEVLSKEEAFADPKNTNNGFEQIFSAAEKVLLENPETKGKFSEFDMFVIKVKSSGGNEIYYPFVTALNNTPGEKSLVTMILSVGNEVKIASLNPVNMKFAGSEEEYGTLSLLRNPATGEDLSTPWPIFSFPVSIEEYRALSDLEKESLKITFTPYGDQNVGPRKEVPVSGVKLARLVAVATEVPATPTPEPSPTAEEGVTHVEDYYGLGPATIRELPATGEDITQDVLENPDKYDFYGRTMTILPRRDAQIEGAGKLSGVEVPYLLLTNKRFIEISIVTGGSSERIYYEGVFTFVYMTSDGMRKINIPLRALVGTEDGSVTITPESMNKFTLGEFYNSFLRFAKHGENFDFDAYKSSLVSGEGDPDAVWLGNFSETSSEMEVETMFFSAEPYFDEEKVIVTALQ